jgi:hypothetical protein
MNFKKMAAESPEKYPARMGQAWDEEETVKLLKSLQKKKSIGEIATEHERTPGAINARRRQLAADYWFNDNRSLEEIEKYTGLTRQEIEGVIQKRIAAQKVKEAAKKFVAPAATTASLATSNEVIDILKDIQAKLTILVEKLAS